MLGPEMCVWDPGGREELEKGKLEALQELGADGRTKPGTAPGVESNAGNS